MKKLLFLICFSMHFYCYCQNNLNYRIEYDPKTKRITKYQTQHIEIGSTITINYFNFPPKNSSWFWLVVVPYKEKYEKTSVLAGSGRLSYSDYINQNGNWTTTIDREGKFEVLTVNGISGFSLEIYRCITINSTKKKLSLNTMVEAEKKLHISPNPTNGLCFIETGKSISEIQLHNQIGQAVLKTATHSIDLSHHPNGIYFATIQNTDGTTMRRKIIKK